MSMSSLRLQHDIDLGYPSSIGLKRAHIITVIQTYRVTHSDTDQKSRFLYQLLNDPGLKDTNLI